MGTFYANFSKTGSAIITRFHEERNFIPQSQPFGCEARTAAYETSNEMRNDGNVHSYNLTGQQSLRHMDFGVRGRASVAGKYHPGNLFDGYNETGDCRRVSSISSSSSSSGRSVVNHSNRQNSSSSLTGGCDNRRLDGSRFSNASPAISEICYNPGTRGRSSSSSPANVAGNAYYTHQNRNSRSSLAGGFDSNHPRTQPDSSCSGMGGGGDVDNYPWQNRDVPVRDSGHITSGTASSPIDLSSVSSLLSVHPAQVGGGAAGSLPEDNGNDDRGQDEGVGFSDSGPGSRINLKLKALIIEGIEGKMKESGIITSGARTQWSWKGTPRFWKSQGKPLIDAAYKTWCGLPPNERTKYGGHRDETNNVRQSTAEQFLSKMKADYHVVKASCKTSTSFISKFWQDLSPTVAAIITMDKAKCNNDDNGTAAVQATTAKNNQAFQARGRATQDIVENMKEVLDSLRETAKKLSDCNDKNHELAEERLKQGRQHQKRMGEINKRVEDRAAARVAQRTTREHEMNARQDKATAASAKQHEEWMAMASTTYATPPDDAQLPWSSYEEFWVSVGNISQDIQDGVASAVPQFGDLIGLARDKNFKAALTETDIPGLAGLVACRIAEKIHVHVYGK